MSSERNADHERPNPEELLDRYNLRDQVPAATPSGLSSDTHHPKRGKLRIYLGMAAGVGKTYAMLNEGHRRKSRGTDVVIGYGETHHRPITNAQIGDLEIVPRKKLPYRNIMMEEMDVDAVLARKPQVALVDELAHTNVLGSRNPKRYQDVEELLSSGINVIATLNIQHLEGLNDIVESITGVRQRETLPDRVLDEAEDVELIDIAPEALRSRLRHGNVYPPEQAMRALDNYFSQGNLTALRELALRRMAEKTEVQLEALMRGSDRDQGAWGSTATERVMVAFSAESHAKRLLREGWRLARALKAPLLAVTVERGSPLSTPDLEHEAALVEYERLATDLGAEVVRLRGGNVARELARVARERHVTQIVIGQPSASGLRGLLLGSVANQLLRQHLDADVHVVPDRSQRV
jgi:two-component system sensor histidine kinase KdpD